MKGRVFLGVISGFMFGLFLGPTLWLWGVIPFASPLIWILPLVGIVLGMIMAAWAPFGKGPEASTEPVSTESTTTPPESESESTDSVSEAISVDRTEEE
jgi:hypothetical protein